MHNSLVAGRKTRGYIRYSPAFISFTVLPDRPLQSTLESRSRRSPEERSTTSSVPVDQEYLGGSQAGGLALFDRVVFVLAFLRHPCILVSVLRYLCFR